MKIAYIISLYFGARRVEAAAYRVDRMSYLHTQLKQLKKISHSISKVIFVINEEEGCELSQKETARASELISSFQGMECSLIVRGNEGFSYAAWDDALKKYSKDFDYCFLIEDDYVPVVDDFDKKFLNFFYENEKLAYVCQLWWMGGAHQFHAGISNGLIKTAPYIESGGFVLRDEKRVSGDHRFNHSYCLGQLNQVFYLDNITNRGYEVMGTEERYKVCFLTHEGQAQYFGREDAHDLLLPIHENIRLP